MIVLMRKIVLTKQYLLTLFVNFQFSIVNLSL